MTKQEYEKVRQEIAKRYKDRISELERKNAALRSKLNEIPESIRNIMELTNVLGR